MAKMSANKTNNDEIVSFIKNFQNEGTIDTFLNGCCYWFAKILFERFMSPYEEHGHDCKIYYNQILGHFATMIDGKLYDITGEIPLTDEWKMWYDWVIGEPVYGQVVVRDCILKKDE